MKKYRQKYGDFALITGASSGIGREFAHQIAAKGMNLVLVARRKNRLADLAQELSRKYQIEVKSIEQDLLAENSVENVVTQTKDSTIGLLILCAGMEVHGDFLEHDIKDETNLLRLNSLIPMQLAHIYGNEMKKRRKGGIMFVSSTFGHQAVPFFSNYAASKAFVLSLGQALNYELKKSGVDVTVLSPGLTKTEMVDGMTNMNFKKMPIVEMQVQPVVKKALKHLGKKQIVVPGFRNRMMDALGKYTTPRPILTNMFGFLVSRSLK